MVEITFFSHDVINTLLSLDYSNQPGTENTTNSIIKYNYQEDIIELIRERN